MGAGHGEPRLEGERAVPQADALSVELLVQALGLELSPVSSQGTAEPSGALLTTAAASGGRAPITRGTPGLASPAFSPAIAARLVPSFSVCSSSMLVTQATAGVTMFVESRRPPSPTSSTA
jgi:hypothetical protein